MTNLTPLQKMKADRLLERFKSSDEGAREVTAELLRRLRQTAERMNAKKGDT